MIYKDYYKILDLKTSRVSIDEIKVAYRAAAKKYHPDVNIGVRGAEERFKDINEAYQALINEQTRRKYDRLWNSRIGRKKAKAKKAEENKTTTRSEILNVLFGLDGLKSQETTYQRKNKDVKVPIQGEDVETQIPISVIEGFYGQAKSISLRTVNGKMRTFEVKIPAGIRNGEMIRLIGQGKPGENGGKNGDLLIRINMEQDKKYKLVGSDIYTELNISPSEAVLGAKVNVDAIDESLGVYIPKGIETGEEIQIEQKGYKDGKGGRGKFIIKVKIMIPKKLSNKEIELYKELKKVSKFNPREL